MQNLCANLWFLCANLLLLYDCLSFVISWHFSKNFLNLTFTFKLYLGGRLSTLVSANYKFLGKDLDLEASRHLPDLDPQRGGGGGGGGHMTEQLAAAMNIIGVVQFINSTPAFFLLILPSKKILQDLMQILHKIFTL